MNEAWKLLEYDASVEMQLAESLGIRPLLARVLASRGITTVDEARRFLEPSLIRDWSDPCSISGMDQVIDAVEAAVRNKRRILVFGDFDVDGITATALMVRGLTALGANPSYLVPNRMAEGYGLSLEVLPRVLNAHPEVVITVDCGIASHDEVAELASQGIEVIITDHHEPPKVLPVGVPVTDPKLEPHSPTAILSGVGVALKLMEILGKRFDQPDLWLDLIDLAALGTLADLMPLIGENRSLVKQGVSLLETQPRPGVSALLSLARPGKDALHASDLSFSLIPRLNAAGRLGDPLTALQLLISDDPTEAQLLAKSLDETNTERRAIENGLLCNAEAQALDSYHGQKILVLAGEDWHEGVKGIVAARLVKRFGIPVIVFSIKDDLAHGSGRTAGAINLFQAVQACAGLTERFGGHEAAIGVTLRRERLNEFTRQIETYLENEPEADLQPPLLADVSLRLAEVDCEAVEELKRLEPFGQGNRDPIFVAQGVFVKNARPVGAHKNHLSFAASDGRCSVQAIWFNCPDIEHYSRFGGIADMAFRLQVDEWNGTRRAKLMIEDIFPYEEALGDDEDLPEEETFVQVEEPFVSTIKVLSEVVDPYDLEALATMMAGGPRTFHESQRKALDALVLGDSVLAVLATGRGKSLIFQVYAAHLALTARQTSIIVYPLRALIADQHNHMLKSFSRLGLEVRALTGENSHNEKDDVFCELYAGKVDVLLTTPEFFRLHLWRFAESKHIGFIVYDEAHHISTETASERDGYSAMGEVRRTFPKIPFLAVTATADDKIAGSIKKALGITRTVIDATRRENLKVNDARNTHERDNYLASLVASSYKAAVFVNSRSQAIILARMLRKRAPRDKQRIAFYHSKLTRAERNAIEGGFRSGEFSTIISTSAFGEGVDIPDITDVILYHLPLNRVAFNQTSGRAGRNGEPATIHLLFTHADRDLDRKILSPRAPSHGALQTLYRALKSYEQPLLLKDATNRDFADLITSCVNLQPDWNLDERGIMNAFAIFEELDLLDIQYDGTSRWATLTKEPKRVELSSSSIYLEGWEELRLFEDFCTWAFDASTTEIQDLLTGPLIPNDE